MPDFTSFTQEQFEQHEAQRRECHVPYVHLHHSLLGKRGALIVQSWRDGQLQQARLDALQAVGYRYRDSWNRTDIEFIGQAKMCGQWSALLDHAFFFRHGDDNVIVFHTYREDIEADVQEVARRMSDRWRCQINAQVSEQFNFYYPEWGNGFELRRHHRVRARRGL
jgi:hypothetical protein